MRGVVAGVLYIRSPRAAELPSAGDLLDFRLVLDFGTTPFGQSNDLSQKLLVSLSQDVRAEQGEFVGAFRVLEPADDVLEKAVVDLERQRPLVGWLAAILLRREMEQPGVVAVVRLVE